MSIFKVVLVLGKRLVDDKLTKEGISRVEALAQILPNLQHQHTALVFCGGVMQGQSVSEAKAMYKEFIRICPRHAFPSTHIILEDQSTNTVENISNAADKLIESQLCQVGEKVTFVFVSNDYHLERVFEIQRLLDEQGLLRVLKTKCEQSGLVVHLPYSLESHCAVPYPHTGTYAEAFLAVDELTTYRVYLEGVRKGAFLDRLERVRAEPLNIANHAIHKLNSLNLPVAAVQSLKLVETLINETTPDLCAKALELKLTQLDAQLRFLNRYFDPEQKNV